MDDLSASDTIPFNRIHNSQVALEHEVGSKISEEQLLLSHEPWLIPNREATEMIVMGFVEPFTKNCLWSMLLTGLRLNYEWKRSVG